MVATGNGSPEQLQGKSNVYNQSANKVMVSNSYAMGVKHATNHLSQHNNSVCTKSCGCPCVCQQQTSQTSHMMSILSTSQQVGHKNNTMTLIKGQRGGLSSLGPHTTIYGEESLIENGEIEELHYLMVRVEKMKK